MKTRIPLLKDHHNHVYLYGVLSGSLNIANLDSKNEALQQIRALQQPFNIVLGWNDSKFSFTPGELDKLPPCVIFNLSLHGILINSGAKKPIANAFPELLENLDNQIWIEKNLTRILSRVAGILPFDPSHVENFFTTLRQKGVWYAEDMFTESRPYLDYIFQSPFAPRTAVWTNLETFGQLPPPLQAKIKGIKLFTDGALGTFSAALEKPYSNGSKGILVKTDEELAYDMRRVAQTGKLAAIHAIGDRAAYQILRILKQLKTRENIDLPVRIEHCQFMSEQKAREALELGVTLSLQPNFNYDSVYYGNRLPKGYAEANNPVRMLIDQCGFEPGKNLLFGSDGMPHGAEFALQHSIFPPFEGQKLELEEFVQGYCLPNSKAGHIDLDIDFDKKKVSIYI